ncbi:MAG: hypothetical protein WCX22_09245 [Methanoregula sp.]
MIFICFPLTLVQLIVPVAALFIVISTDPVAVQQVLSLPDNACVRPIRENAPGPDRSTIATTFPIRREGFVCPFTVPSPVSPE